MPSKIISIRLRKITIDIVIHHIKQAFLQCYTWLHAPFVESIEINSEDYRYELTEDDILVPIITSKDVIPDDFPLPCNCLKCVKKNVCSYRVKLTSCC